MPVEMKRFGWVIARWNLLTYIAVVALVLALGGLDPTAALAG